jgi:hypothetical protein
MFKPINFLTLAVTASFLSACGGDGTSADFLKNVNLSVTTQNNDAYLNLVSTFDLGKNVSLAEMAVTIIDPKTRQDRGTVQFSQLPGGIGQITVNVNASMAANADAKLGETLPNGKPLPLALGAHTGEVLGVKLLEHSRIYLGGDTRTSAYAGVGLSISGLDQVMDQLSTAANIFFMGNFSNNVLGVGGIYGSPVKDESGIAIFGKYTAGKSVDVQQLDASHDYEIEKLNRATTRKLMRFFYGNKKRVLKFN